MNPRPALRKVTGDLELARQPRRRVLWMLAFGAVWLFIFTIPWENLIVLPGVGTSGRIAGALAFALGGLAALDAGQKPRLRPPHAWMAVFVCWASITYYWSIAPDRSVEEILTFLQLLGMALLLAEFIREVSDLRLLMLAYVLGSYIAVGATVWAYFNNVAINYNRFAPNGFNPGDLGLTVAISIPMSLYLASCQKHWLLSWLVRLHLPIAMAGILLTAARGALIAACVALLIIPPLMIQWTPGQRMVFGVITCLAAATVPLIVPESSWTRLGTIADELRTGTLNQRRDIWKAGVDLFREQPFSGVGLGAFAPAVERVLGTPVQPKQNLNGPADVVALVAHNTFISVMVEQGLIGLAIFLMLLLSLLFSSLQMHPPLRGLCLVIVMTWAVGVMDLTWEYRKPTWFVFGIIASTTEAPGRRKRRPIKQNELRAEFRSYRASA